MCCALYYSPIPCPSKDEHSRSNTGTGQVGHAVHDAVRTVDSNVLIVGGEIGMKINLLNCVAKSRRTLHSTHRSP